MVTRQPHHEYGQERGPEDDENRTSPAGPCGDVAAYVLGVLDPAEHVSFSRHLAGCERCQRDVADFGLFAPALRPVLSESPPGVRRPCGIARSILVVAAGVVVAIAAVLSVVESLSSHADDPVEVGTFTRAESAQLERFPLFGRVWVRTETREQAGEAQPAAHQPGEDHRSLPLTTATSSQFR